MDGKKALIGMSGGVDSSVAALLCSARVTSASVRPCGCTTMI